MHHSRLQMRPRQPPRDRNFELRIQLLHRKRTSDFCGKYSYKKFLMTWENGDIFH